MCVPTNFLNFICQCYSTQIPICLAGTDTDEFLTAEPAVVVEDEELDDFWDDDEQENQSEMSLNHQSDLMPLVPRSPPSPRRRAPSVTAPTSQAPRSLVLSNPDPPTAPSPPPVPTGSPDELLLKSPAKKAQHGVTLRRTANKMRRRASTVNGCHVDQDHITKLLEDQNITISPFERPIAFEQENSTTSILDNAPTRQRRRSIATGSSWLNKSASSVEGENSQRPASRGSAVMNRPRSSSRDQSWASRSSSISADFSSLQEEIEILSVDASTSYTDTSTSKNGGAKFD